MEQYQQLEKIQYKIDWLIEEMKPQIMNSPFDEVEETIDYFIKEIKYQNDKLLTLEKSIYLQYLDNQIKEKE